MKKILNNSLPPQFIYNPPPPPSNSLKNNKREDSSLKYKERKNHPASRMLNPMSNTSPPSEIDSYNPKHRHNISDSQQKELLNYFYNIENNKQKNLENNKKWFQLPFFRKNK